MSQNIEINVKTTSGYDPLYPRNNTTLVYTSVSVPIDLWVASTTYVDYPFQASISLNKVTSDYVSHVNFNVAEQTSGNFAGVSLTNNGIVTIYATEKPISVITIPSIDLVKEI